MSQDMEMTADDLFGAESFGGRGRSVKARRETRVQTRMRLRDPGYSSSTAFGSYSTSQAARDEALLRTIGHTAVKGGGAIVSVTGPGTALKIDGALVATFF